MWALCCPFPSASLASEVAWTANEIAYDCLGLVMIMKLLHSLAKTPKGSVWVE